MSNTNLQFAITYIKWHLIFGVDHFFLAMNTFLKMF